MGPQPSAQGNVSLSDLLTTAKNIVNSLANLYQSYLNVQGAQNKAAIAAPTVVKTSAGRVATVVVTTGGAATGLIYDAAAVGATLYPIYVIPTTVGVYLLNMPCNYGIVVSPGSGQVVTLSWS